jgi:hypothetical protein
MQRTVRYYKLARNYKTSEMKLARRRNAGRPQKYTQGSALSISDIFIVAAGERDNYVSVHQHC